MRRKWQGLSVLVLSLLLLITGVAGAAGREGKIVIAHRGASGYLPEHTLEGEAMAYALGADYIEPDVVLTKDGVPIVLHDIWLDLTTNVRQLFPTRARSDGRWYAIDFTLAEIKTLRVNERVRLGTDTPVYAGRFPWGKAKFEVPTLAETIELVQGLNKSTGRNVGIYPELKAPAFHHQHGFDFERLALDFFTSYGYEGPEARIFVQCFEASALERLRFELGTKLPLIQLISGGKDNDWMVTPEGLDRIAKYADGIGPSTSRIVDRQGRHTTLVQDAHQRRLLVHPYTFRRDELPPYAKSLEDQLRLFYFELGVDGVFTDFTDVAVGVLRAASPGP